LRQIDAFTTPGSLLKAARVARGLSEREAADRLHMMPDYVSILENDDYEALRSPAFARGYLKAYCRLLEADEREVLELYEHTLAERDEPALPRPTTRPPQLQRTGLGVVTGLGVMFVIVIMLWWRGENEQIVPRPAIETGVFPEDVQVLGGESR